MTIEIRKINRSNYEECIALKVRKDQENFVASNIRSLVEAAYEPELHPLAIYNDDQMIGFVLYDFDEDIKGWSMSRFMIGEQFQHLGYGKAALQAFLSYFKTNYPSVDTLYTSAEVENKVAIHLYETYGFQPLKVFSYTYDGATYTEMRMKLVIHKGKHSDV